MVELEQLALDPAIIPSSGSPGPALHQCGDDVVDRWSSGPVRAGPPSPNEAAMPAQDGARGDQAMAE